jgi:hypothetical protein
VPALRLARLTSLPAAKTYGSQRGPHGETGGVRKHEVACDLKVKNWPFWNHDIAGKVILQNSCGYLMLQIAVDILAVMFFIA